MKESKKKSREPGRPVSVTKKIGGWVEMDFDRELTHRSVRWLRVKGGFGARGDREDWVADVDELTVAVADSSWRPPYFGFHRYPSMRAAMDDQLRRGIAQLEEQAQEMAARLDRVRSSLAHVKENLRAGT